jgi:hypothetical protein
MASGGWLSETGEDRASNPELVLLASFTLKMVVQEAMYHLRK